MIAVTRCSYESSMTPLIGRWPKGFVTLECGWQDLIVWNEVIKRHGREFDNSGYAPQTSRDAGTIKESTLGAAGETPRELSLPD